MIQIHTYIHTVTIVVIETRRLTNTVKTIQTRFIRTPRQPVTVTPHTPFTLSVTPRTKQNMN